MANDYEISRASGKCAATGRTFNENEFYYAALFETAEGFERKDYCLEAWSGPPENCFCYWKGRVPAKEKKPTTIVIDNSILMNLFCRLEEDTSPMRQKFRFVLALLLMRKRLLRFEQAIRNDTQEYWQVRLVQEQSVQQVLNPQLSEQEIEQLSAQLTAILSGDASAITQLEEDESTTQDQVESASDETEQVDAADESPAAEEPRESSESSDVPSESPDGSSRTD